MILPEIEIESLIQKFTKIYQVDPSWIKAIVTTESNWDPYAIRYEVNYSYLCSPDKFSKAGISISTEIATQKMSWGLGQIMGALAREQGHTGFLSELIKPDVNIKHLCIRLNYLKRNVSEQASDIFACYNGGPGAVHKINGGVYFNQAYVDRVNSNLMQFAK